MKEPNSNLEIEIIPWIHSFRSDVHPKIVEYICSLPRGVNIFIEVAQQSLVELGSYFRAKRKRINNPKTRSRILDMCVDPRFETLLAVLNIYLAAEINGLNLIPVFVEHKDSKITDNLNILKEKQAVQRILKSNPKGKVYVLVGADHAKNMCALLKANGISNTNINQRFSRDCSEELDRIFMKGWPQHYCSDGRDKQLIQQMETTNRIETERVQRLKQRIAEKRARKEQGKRRLDVLKRVQKERPK